MTKAREALGDAQISSDANFRKQYLRLRETTPFTRYSNDDVLVIRRLVAETGEHKVLLAKLDDELKMRGLFI